MYLPEAQGLRWNLPKLELAWRPYRQPGQAKVGIVAGLESANVWYASLPCRTCTLPSDTCRRLVSIGPVCWPNRLDTNCLFSFVFCHHHKHHWKMISHFRMTCRSFYNYAKVYIVQIQKQLVMRWFLMIMVISFECIFSNSVPYFVSLKLCVLSSINMIPFLLVLVIVLTVRRFNRI